jgi:hypothetical protein
VQQRQNQNHTPRLVARDIPGGTAPVNHSLPMLRAGSMSRQQAICGGVPSYEGGWAAVVPESGNFLVNCWECLRLRLQERTIEETA